MELSMEEKRELEEIKEVEWEMLDIELVKGFAREEGMAGDEAADETGNGRGEGILSMVSNFLSFSEGTNSPLVC